MTWTKEKQKAAELCAGCNTVLSEVLDIQSLLDKMKSAAANYVEIEPRDISQAAEKMRRLPELLEKFVEKKL